MLEKHNHSNDPNATQPIKADGTFAHDPDAEKKKAIKEKFLGFIKNGAKVKKYKDGNAILILDPGSKMLGELNDLAGGWGTPNLTPIFNEEYGTDYEYLIFVDEYDFDEYGEDLNFKLGNEETPDEDDDFDEDEGIFDFINPDLDEFTGFEAIGLEGKAFTTFNAYGVKFNLDSYKMKNASEEQIAKLEESVENSMKLSEMGTKAHDLLSYPVSGIWQYETVTPMEVGEKIEDGSFEKKISFLLNKKSEATEPGMAAHYQGKIDQLYELKSRKDKLDQLCLELEGMTGKAASVKTILSDISEAESNAMDEIAAFQKDKPDVEELSKTIKESYKRYAYAIDYTKNLPYEKKDALQNWISSSYHAITEPLLGIKYHGYKQGDFEATVRGITESIKGCKAQNGFQVQRYTGDLRGIQGIVGKGAKNGQSFNDSLKGYMDAGGDMNAIIGKMYRNNTFTATAATEGMGYNSHESDAFYMRINVPKGSSFCYMGGTLSGGEDELLLQRGSTFRIDAVRKRSGFRYEIEVTLVEEPSDEELESSLKNALQYT